MPFSNYWAVYIEKISGGTLLNLLQYFKTLNRPTKAQEEALVNLDKFLSSDNRCFALKGYAVRR